MFKDMEMFFVDMTKTNKQNRGQYIERIFPKYDNRADTAKGISVVVKVQQPSYKASYTIISEISLVNDKMDVLESKDFDLDLGTQSLQTINLLHKMIDGIYTNVSVKRLNDFNFYDLLNTLYLERWYFEYNFTKEEINHVFAEYVKNAYALESQLPTEFVESNKTIFMPKELIRRQTVSSVPACNKSILNFLTDHDLYERNNKAIPMAMEPPEDDALEYQKYLYDVATGNIPSILKPSYNVVEKLIGSMSMTDSNLFGELFDEKEESLRINF